MPVESKLFSLLSAATIVTFVTSARLYPLAIPQGVAAFPALVYSRTGGQRINSLSGYSGLENPIITIDCWATSYAGAKDLSTRVESAMSAATAFAAIMIGDTDGPGPEIGQFRVTQEWSLWNRTT